MTCPECSREVLIDHVIAHKSSKRECDLCGNPAVKKKHGLYVCEDCANL